MGTKFCTSCFVKCDLKDGFYKHPQMADGYLNKCKKCVKSRVNKHRDKNITKARAYDRERYHNDPERKKATRETFARWAKENPEGPTIASREWRKRNPEKYRAQNTVNNAIRNGKFERKGCVVCGEKAHAHHEDYSKPLEVVWLCPKHHSDYHMKNRNTIEKSPHKKKA